MPNVRVVIYFLLILSSCTHKSSTLINGSGVFSITPHFGSYQLGIADPSNEKDLFYVVNTSFDSILFFETHAKEWKGFALEDTSQDEWRAFGGAHNGCFLLMGMTGMKLIELNTGLCRNYVWESSLNSSGKLILRHSDLCNSAPMLISDSIVVMSQMVFEHDYWDPEFFSSEILCLYNLKSGTFNSLPVFYPKEYANKSKASLVHFWYTLDSKGNIVLTFEGSSTIGIYNISDQSFRFIEPDLPNYSFDILEFDRQFQSDFNRVSDFRIESAKFGEIKFDKYRNCFYRFVFPKQALQNDDGSFNQDWPRKSLLLLYTSDFKLKESIELNKFSQPEFNFIREDGFYIRNIHEDKQKRSNSMDFMVYNVDSAAML